jgi:hypothetical protein
VCAQLASEEQYNPPIYHYTVMMSLDASACVLLVNSIANLEHFKDVQILCGGYSAKVHKIVLSAMSGYVLCAQ